MKLKILYININYIQEFIYFPLKIIHFPKFSEQNLKQTNKFLGKENDLKKGAGVIFQENIHPCKKNIWNLTSFNEKAEGIRWKTAEPLKLPTASPESNYKYSL